MPRPTESGMHKQQNGLGLVFSPVVLCPCELKLHQFNRPLTILVTAYQCFWLFLHNEVYRLFTCVDHTIQA